MMEPSKEEKRKRKRKRKINLLIIKQLILC